MKIIQGIRCFVAVLIILSTDAALARASEPAQPVTNLLNDPAALEAFVDNLVTNRMRESHVPGAVVTIVKDDKVLLNKGYGFANLEQHTPVDPDKTLFRIASVSKVFNAMMVMRLVDQGLLDVNEDVRPRLAAAGLELDSPEKGPITLKALLTHSAGIRDLNVAGVTSTTNRENVLRLGPYLQRCLPLRWEDPGETELYTDHGISLAGYVAELAAKMRFEEVVRQQVLLPLGMAHTIYMGPGEQSTNLAVAYSFAVKGYRPMPAYYCSVTPAVGVLTTGSDMARLMICHLSGCKDYLKPQTVNLIHEPQFAEDARLGLQATCGFFQGTPPYLKETYLFHSGGWAGFGSSVSLSLTRGVGIFVAKSGGGWPLFDIDDLLNALPEEPKLNVAKTAPAFITSAPAIANIKSLAGTYVSGRRLSRGTKLSEEDYVHVRYVDEIKGVEVNNWQTRNDPTQFIPVTPDLFKAVKGSEQVSFHKSKDGTKTYLIDYNLNGDGAFAKIQ
jgi:CubicO group peptidase (beta-lactamase class C family)